MFTKILSYFKKHLLLLIISIAMAITCVLTQLIIPYLFGVSIDYIIGENNVNFDKLLTNLIIIGILILLSSISSYIMNLTNNKVAYSVIKDIRNEAFKKIELLQISYIDKNPKVEIISKVITDTEQLENGILMALSQFFTGLMTIVGVIIIMITINIWIALFVVVLTPLSLFAAKWISKNAYKSFKLQSEKRAIQTSIVDELIGNQKVVCAYNYEEKSVERFTKSNEELSKVSLKATFISSLVNPTTRFINSLIYATVALVGTLIVIKTDGISIGMLVSLLGYANQYTKPFNEITGVISELQNAYACAERIFALIDEENEKENIKEKITNTDVITIDNINFSYKKEKELIRDFSLKISRGEKIAIVGPTGCGKTTFINLLMRFYDCDSGDIKIGGTSIYDVSRKDLRSHFGMVLQDTWLRNGTFLENLTMGITNINMDEVIEVCKKVKIYHFIKQLPNGFNQMVKNDDSLLSKGQRQLLCIARVMLVKPEFLILDEATSNIDTRTEIIVQDAFKELMKNKTSFIVAHRLSTIRECNKIIVMNDGKIVEVGTHQELLENHQLYYQMHTAQYK